MTNAASPALGSARASQPGELLRLNLGGAGEGFREGKIEGFKTVDLRQAEGVDYVCDASDLSQFSDGSVHEIYASNILEHFPIPKTVPVLQEWRRVLAKGAKLWISVPDFDASVRLYLRLGLQPWVQYLIWGDQKHPLNYHYINFTWPHLAHCLHKAGFTEFRRVQNLPYGLQDASVLVDNVDGKPISLNVEATK